MFETNNHILKASDGFNGKYICVFIPIVYIIQVALANYLALVIKFESDSLPAYLGNLWPYLPILIVIRLGFYFQTGLNKSYLRSSGVHDLIKIIKTIAFGSITFLIVIRYLIGDTSYLISVYILDLLLLLIFSGGPRLFVMICSPKN